DGDAGCSGKGGSLGPGERGSRESERVMRRLRPCRHGPETPFDIKDKAGRFVGRRTGWLRRLGDCSAERRPRETKIPAHPGAGTADSARDGGRMATVS